MHERGGSHCVRIWLLCGVCNDDHCGQNKVGARESAESCCGPAAFVRFDSGGRFGCPVLSMLELQERCSQFGVTVQTRLGPMNGSVATWQ